MLTSLVAQGHKAFFVQARCMSSQKKICALIVGKLKFLTHIFQITVSPLMISADISIFSLFFVRR